MAAEARVLLIAPSLDILGGQAVQAMHLFANVNGFRGVRMRFQPIDPRLGPFAFLKKIRFVRTIATFLVYLPSVMWRAATADIVHIFSAGLTSFTVWTIPAVLLGRLYGKKVILHYHDGQAEVHIATSRFAMPILRMADVVVTPSYFLVDVFAKYGIKARSIFNVLETSGFHFRQCEKLKPVFMTNRILEPLYNIGCILRAFAIIQQRYPEATLTIAHSGMCRPELEKLAEELKLNHTRFVGRVPHTEAASLYDAADIYLTTPNFDCMPGSILECYASGVPVVATKAGGILYIATDEKTALLVDLNDHQAVAERCFRLLEDPELVKRLTQAGYAELEKYRPGRSRDQWADLYIELMEQRAGAPEARRG